MIEIIVYIIVVIFVVMWCYFKWRNRHFEKLEARMPGLPAYPFIGTAYQFIGLTPERIMSRILDYEKDYNLEPFRAWLGPYFVVIIIKPEDLQIVLNSSKALQKGCLYKFFQSILGEGLFTAPVDKWRKHRRMITPLFNGKLLEQFFPVFIEKNQILIRNVAKQLNETQAFDLWDYIAPFALDTICQNTLGYNLDTQTSKNECEFAEAIVTTTELEGMRIYKPWLYPEIVFSMYLKLTGQQRVFETVRKFPLQVIKEKKAEFDQRKKSIEAKIDVTNNNENQSKLFLDTLFELNNDGGNFSDSDIRDEVVTMLTGGSETSAITVCFCLLMLAIDQDIQDKVYDEIYDIFDESHHVISIKDTTRLVYLEQVLKETLRLFPVGPLLLREIQEDLKIFSCDYVLPKGTTCVLAPLGTHLSPDLYSNPRDFNPENFSPENIAKRHRYSFIPFSGGPRGCIGSKYAILSMKVTVSTFLRHFSIHTDIKLTDIKLKLGLLMRSVDGYPVTIRPRDKRPTYKRNQKPIQ
ncbi:cytochrome P450 4C1-like [Metopolophium dirhodum]|uniref:cytochrome P450 4C1-like n=1 Tax=Metopolophium dirhodum TaxID=44670 RepID=UPI0029903B55|nr:cytochrome P450 4C1-like [Metopolophium dirhodum]